MYFQSQFIRIVWFISLSRTGSSFSIFLTERWRIVFYNLILIKQLPVHLLFLVLLEELLCLQSHHHSSIQTVQHEAATENFPANQTSWCSQIISSQSAGPRMTKIEEVWNYLKDCHYCVRITLLKQTAACNPISTHPRQGTELHMSRTSHHKNNRTWVENDRYGQRLHLTPVFLMSRPTFLVSKGWVTLLVTSKAQPCDFKPVSVCLSLSRSLNSIDVLTLLLRRLAAVPVLTTPQCCSRGRAVLLRLLKVIKTRGKKQDFILYVCIIYKVIGNLEIK